MSVQLDLEILAQPIAPERPWGESLEDTTRLAAFDEFRLFGRSTPFDPAPDWNEVKDRALEALARSKDLRLLAHLAAALLRTNGLPAFSQTLTIAAEWLDASWDGTYPRVDEDAILRRNALNCLADPIAVVDGVRRIPLVDSRQHGRFSLRDLDIAAGLQAGDAGTRRDEEPMNAAFASMPLDQLRLLERSVVSAAAALRRLDARMREKGGPDAAPVFDPLLSQLVRLERVLGARLAARPDGDRAAGAPASPIGAEGNGERSGRAGPVRSREEATRAMDAIAVFFRQQEPSSPIPLLLERAKRLVSKDFMDVLADIAPDAVAHARAASGLRPE